MKDSVKKKFLDILFDPDDDEDEVEQSNKKAAKEENPYRAKDVLYHKSNTSAFIDLNTNNSNKETDKVEETENDYEFSSQISPIFGIIKEGKKPERKIRPVDEKVLGNPDDSHLNIVTSPIYGYGSSDDNNVNDSFMVDNNEYDLEEDEQPVIFETNKSEDLQTFDDFSNDDDEINLFNSIGKE